MKHTASIIGNDYYHGNSGLWQGVFSSGRSHTIAIEQKSGTTYTSNIDEFNTRAMDIISWY